MLDLLDLDLGITLTVTLFPLVLLAAFFFEDDDLFTAAMANDRGLNRSAAADFRIFPFTQDEGFEVDLFAGLSLSIVGTRSSVRLRPETAFRLFL